jgi:hypothetical protein
MQQLIHVKIGLTDGVYPVRKFYTEGVFKDIYEFQENANTIAWVHKRWCTPVSAPQAASDSVPCHGLQAVDSVTTDWRTFLKAHWDSVHNCCQVEYLNEFYAIFRRAAAAYINKQNHEQDKVKSHHQSGAHEPRRADALLHPSGRQRPAAAVSAGDKAKVRETNRQMKPVELSLFPDL